MFNFVGNFYNTMVGHIWSLGDNIATFFEAISPEIVSKSVGATLSTAGILVGSYALIKSIFSGDEGAKTIKQLALISLIPASLVSIAVAINFSDLSSYLTSFFVVIRKLLYVWDFWINVPLLFSLFLSSLLLMSAYWGYKAVRFVVRFFNSR